MTNHQQAAVDSAARVLFCMQHRVSESRFDLAAYEALAEASTREARNALTAATPHLRAEWEQPIRELCEGAIKRANDPLAARGFNGETFPATVYAQDILALLEGGGE